MFCSGLFVLYCCHFGVAAVGELCFVGEEKEEFHGVDDGEERVGSSDHRLCTGLCLESLLCDNELVLVGDRGEIDEIDHSVDKDLYICIYLFVPILLDCIEIVSR